ncbi:glycosyltransferase involved in cell wall biosynthesis [Flavobacterium sp. 90]|uniref:glycosyltransferase family 2 protein n=1 Tax=unclassified Flavobacterium TaxID=196869 RepID=UPI000EB5BCBE|nr:MULTISPECIES: glycosyltransferase family 2 protein [unclassified Flavobacterium]RKR08353.1 glycosyltransferase involved in cell wall biosynthesis [Flavobacterium sp. 81]TCK57541.1 glycosyltransferase involved in cell wall biosynthesis [Flavobacterium sp. 90]
MSIEGKKLSVIILTYNEESYIGDAIRSVEFADEIIVLDSHSTDSTTKIVTDLGAKLIFRKFDNYCNQRNHAIESTTGEWVLFLDADERVSEELQKEILETINSNKSDAYRIWFPHFFMDRFLFHYTDKITRLVKNDSIRFENEVHEKLVVKSKAPVLKNYMIHYTYKGLFHFISKKDQYAWFQAKMSIKKGKKATLFLLIFKPFYRFFHTYFIKRVYLDGVPGLAAASIDAYGVFSRYAKMVLLEKNLE